MLRERNVSEREKSGGKWKQPAPDLWRKVWKKGLNRHLSPMWEQREGQRGREQWRGRERSGGEGLREGKGGGKEEKRRKRQRERNEIGREGGVEGERE